VPYADIRRPPISVWELRAARRFLAQPGETRRMALLLETAETEVAVRKPLIKLLKVYPNIVMAFGRGKILWRALRSDDK
jgi:hypothetical protein